MECPYLFSGKNKKNIPKFSLLKSLPRVLCVIIHVVDVCGCLSSQVMATEATLWGCSPMKVMCMWLPCLAIDDS